MAEQIMLNAKCQRMGVCNAAESLLVHADVAARVSAARSARRWPNAASKSAATSERANSCRRPKPATEDDYAAEYLGPIISC